MPLVITKEAFLAHAMPMMQAIEMIPEDKRGFSLWSGTFETPDGPREAKAMTPEFLAADVIVALQIMPAVLAGELPMAPETFRDAKARQEELAAKPLAEIARIGREVAAEVAGRLDALGPADLEGEISRPGGAPMPRAMMAALAFSHLVHHRGQLYWALRALGVAPPPYLG